ncbi:SnoaL-like protein [Tahibacter aquaticus]|uniref:SnoaL-like protein n=1 Tax=Tahibacter aquaticus TaxID=520092 RepID=A0A4R6Z4H7_9GAMM|nr:SnoaL-like protein [Tahibacter aquaticus]
MNYAALGNYAIRCVSALALLCIAAGAVAAPAAVPGYVGRHRASAADREAIGQVLAAYTQSVIGRDPARFESLLLSRDIPFSSTDAASGKTAGAVDTRRYADFKAAVFDSGERFQQQFYNVRIAQDGELAQVSLDFVTTRLSTGRGGYGWKVLQLLKVDGEWKIASELYTAYAIP